MAENLRGKTFSGVGWSLIDNIANQGITFLVGLVLARLLTPPEYGIIGIILIFIAIFNCIVDSGFSSALIRKKEVKEIDYNTIFITNMVLSLFLFGVCYLIAPVIASFFAEPQLKPLTRVMGIVVVINAFAIIQRTILVKNINFKTQAKISLISSVLSGIVGIVMALMQFGVLSLVAQQITRQLLNTLLLWYWNKWRPKLQFSYNSFKDLFGFGWKLLVASLIDTIWREIYQVVIGKFYTPATLGQYTRANQFSIMFSGNLTTVIQRVSYPVLSSIQDDRERLKSAYRKVIKTTMFITFVCMFMLAAISHPMIMVLIGNQWVEAATMLPVLCIYMSLYPLHAINLNILQIQGRSDLFLRLEIIKKCVAVIPLCLGIFVGIYWMLWGSVFVGLVSYCLNSLYSGRLINYSIFQQLKDLVPSFALALTSSLIVYSVTFVQASSYIILPIQLLIGVISIILLCYIFKIEEYFYVKNFIQSAIIKVKNGK